jgi:hypothetical protein
MVLDLNIFNANSPTQIQSLTLSSGANTINATSCPALPNSGGVWIIPPAANAVTLALKGISVDTGISLNLTVPFFYPFPITPPTSFVITAGGAVTVQLVWV